MPYFQDIFLNSKSPRSCTLQVPLAAAGGRGGYPGAPPRGQAADGFARPLGARGAPDGGAAPGGPGADVEAVGEERHAWLAYLLNRFGSRGGFDVLVKARARGRPARPACPSAWRARCAMGGDALRAAPGADMPTATEPRVQIDSACLAAARVACPAS